ncbi:hypothetical protein FO519_000812 [Halicephalobus sp. NKZ332]|nr:hypothetical protein FO519_000812 [Halicephalobus sp. NKZ332]
MEKLRSSFDTTLNTLTSECLQPKFIKIHAITHLGQTIRTAKCEEVRNEALKEFQQRCKENFDDLIKEFEVGGRIQEREKLGAEQKNRKGTRGWRVTGNIDVDFYGDSRPILVEHLENLKKLSAELETELKVEKEAFDELSAVVHKRIDHLQLALLDWTSGIRMAYCQEMPFSDLIDPFREAMSKMVNRHCRNATACRLQKPVQFTIHHVILLDGYPKRDNRALIFRFFIVLPPDAVPIDKRLARPLLSRKILADVLRVQLTEFTQRLGWQILSYDKFPRFDPITTFMNRALIPIGIVVGVFMLFLAYWSATISSSSYSSDGWMVSGSTGGKNAALRRTMEIIEEQKYQEEQEQRLQMATDRQVLQTRFKEQPEDLGPPVKQEYGISFDSTGSISELGDQVPEIVVVHTRNSSKDTLDSVPLRKQSHPWKSKGRRFSSHDDHHHKRKKSFHPPPPSSPRQKWKTGSLMLHSFSKDGK